MAEQSFETLKVWQKAHAFMLELHRELLPLLPKEEKFVLADQVRRSSKSIGANIAEGNVVSIIWIMCGFVIRRAVHSMRQSTT